MKCLFGLLFGHDLIELKVDGFNGAMTIIDTSSVSLLHKN